MCAQMTKFVNKNQRPRCIYKGSVYICTSMCVCTRVCIYNIYIYMYIYKLNNCCGAGLLFLNFVISVKFEFSMKNYNKKVPSDHTHIHIYIHI